MNWSGAGFRAGILGLMLSILGAGRAASALSVMPMSLSEVAQDADCIVYGRIVDVQLSRDPRGFPATLVTVAVQRMLKGPAGAEITFKQFGAATDGGGAALVGQLPQYAIDNEVVLFLAKPSRLGFTSPVGFSQGYYLIGPTAPTVATAGV